MHIRFAVRGVAATARWIAVGARGIAAGAAMMICGSTLAHHSVSTNYFNYEEAPVELVGTITEVEIRNPHSLVTLDVVDSDGVTTEWLAEWSDGNALRRRAVDIDLVKVGEEVTIHARRHRKVEYVVYIRDVVLPDGTIVRDCGAGIYRGGEYYATCDEAEDAQGQQDPFNLVP